MEPNKADEDKDNQHSPRRATLLGSAFASVKNFFTPERPTNKLEAPSTASGHYDPNISALGRGLASLSLDDSLVDSDGSFKTTTSRLDDSFKSMNETVYSTEGDTTMIQDSTLGDSSLGDQDCCLRNIVLPSLIAVGDDVVIGSSVDNSLAKVTNTSSKMLNIAPPLKKSHCSEGSKLLDITVFEPENAATPCNSPISVDNILNVTSDLELTMPLPYKLGLTSKFSHSDHVATLGGESAAGSSEKILNEKEKIKIMADDDEDDEISVGLTPVADDDASDEYHSDVLVEEISTYVNHEVSVVNETLLQGLDKSGNTTLAAESTSDDNSDDYHSDVLVEDEFISSNIVHDTSNTNQSQVEERNISKSNSLCVEKNEVSKLHESGTEVDLELSFENEGSTNFNEESFLEYSVHEDGSFSSKLTSNLSVILEKEETTEVTGLVHNTPKVLLLPSEKIVNTKEEVIREGLNASASIVPPIEIRVDEFSFGECNQTVKEESVSEDMDIDQLGEISPTSDKNEVHPDGSHDSEHDVKVGDVGSVEVRKDELVTTTENISKGAPLVTNASKSVEENNQSVAKVQFISVEVDGDQPTAVVSEERNTENLAPNAVVPDSEEAASTSDAPITVVEDDQTVSEKKEESFSLITGKSVTVVNEEGATPITDATSVEEPIMHAVERDATPVVDGNKSIAEVETVIDKTVAAEITVSFTGANDIKEAMGHTSEIEAVSGFDSNKSLAESKVVVCESAVVQNTSETTASFSMASNVEETTVHTVERDATLVVEVNESATEIKEDNDETAAVERPLESTTSVDLACIVDATPVVDDSISVKETKEDNDETAAVARTSGTTVASNAEEVNTSEMEVAPVDEGSKSITEIKAAEKGSHLVVTEEKISEITASVPVENIVEQIILNPVTEVKMVQDKEGDIISKEEMPKEITQKLPEVINDLRGPQRENASASSDSPSLGAEENKPDSVSVGGPTVIHDVEGVDLSDVKTGNDVTDTNDAAEKRESHLSLNTEEETSFINETIPLQEKVYDNSSEHHNSFESMGDGLQQGKLDVNAPQSMPVDANQEYPELKESQVPRSPENKESIIECPYAQGLSENRIKEQGKNIDTALDKRDPTIANIVDSTEVKYMAEVSQESLGELKTNISVSSGKVPETSGEIAVIELDKQYLNEESKGNSNSSKSHEIESEVLADSSVKMSTENHELLVTKSEKSIVTDEEKSTDSSNANVDRLKPDSSVVAETSNSNDSQSMKDVSDILAEELQVTGINSSKAEIGELQCNISVVAATGIPTEVPDNSVMIKLESQLNNVSPENREQFLNEVEALSLAGKTCSQNRSSEVPMNVASCLRENEAPAPFSSVTSSLETKSVPVLDQKMDSMDEMPIPSDEAKSLIEEVAAMAKSAEEEVARLVARLETSILESKENVQTDINKGSQPIFDPNNIANEFCTELSTDNIIQNIFDSKQDFKASFNESSSSSDRDRHDSGEPQVFSIEMTSSEDEAFSRKKLIFPVVGPVDNSVPIEVDHDTSEGKNVGLSSIKTSLSPSVITIACASSPEENDGPSISGVGSLEDRATEVQRGGSDSESIPQLAIFEKSPQQNSLSKSDVLKEQTEISGNHDDLCSSVIRTNVQTNLAVQNDCQESSESKAIELATESDKELTGTVISPPETSLITAIPTPEEKEIKIEPEIPANSVCTVKCPLEEVKENKVYANVVGSEKAVVATNENFKVATPQSSPRKATNENTLVVDGACPTSSPIENTSRRDISVIAIEESPLKRKKHEVDYDSDECEVSPHKRALIVKLSESSERDEYKEMFCDFDGNFLVHEDTTRKPCGGSGDEAMGNMADDSNGSPVGVGHETINLDDTPIEVITLSGDSSLQSVDSPAKPGSSYGANQLRTPVAISGLIKQEPLQSELSPSTSINSQSAVEEVTSAKNSNVHNAEKLEVSSYKTDIEQNENALAGQLSTYIESTSLSSQADPIQNSTLAIEPKGGSTESSKGGDIEESSVSTVDIPSKATAENGEQVGCENAIVKESIDTENNTPVSGEVKLISIVTNSEDQKVAETIDLAAVGVSANQTNDFPKDFEQSAGGSDQHKEPIKDADISQIQLMSAKESVECKIVEKNEKPMPCPLGVHTSVTGTVADEEKSNVELSSVAVEEELQKDGCFQQESSIKMQSMMSLSGGTVSLIEAHELTNVIHRAVHFQDTVTITPVDFEQAADLLIDSAPLSSEPSPNECYLDHEILKTSKELERVRSMEQEGQIGQVKSSTPVDSPSATNQKADVEQEKEISPICIADRISEPMLDQVNENASYCLATSFEYQSAPAYPSPHLNAALVLTPDHERSYSASDSFVNVEAVKADFSSLNVTKNLAQPTQLPSFGSETIILDDRGELGDLNVTRTIFQPDVELVPQKTSNTSVEKDGSASKEVQSSDIDNLVKDAKQCALAVAALSENHNLSTIVEKSYFDESELKHSFMETLQENKQKVWNASVTEAASENKNKNMFSKGHRNNGGVLKEINDNVGNSDNMGSWLSGTLKDTDTNIKPQDVTFKAEDFDIFGGIANPSIDLMPRDSLYVKFDPLFNSGVKTSDSTLFVQALEDMPPECPQRKTDKLINVVSPIATSERKVCRKKESEIQAEITRLKELYIDRERQFAEKENMLKQHEFEIRKECEELKGQVKASKSRIIELSEKSQAFARSKSSLIKIANEFKNTIEGLSCKILSDRENINKKIVEVVAERNECRKHAESAESAMVDVFAKYDKLRSYVLEQRKNQVLYEQKLTELGKEAALYDERIKVAKKAAIDKLDQMQVEGGALTEEKEKEIMRMNAIIRKTNLKMTTLQESYDKMAIENEELAVICEDLIAGKKPN